MDFRLRLRANTSQSRRGRLAGIRDMDLNVTTTIFSWGQNDFFGEDQSVALEDCPYYYHNFTDLNPDTHYRITFQTREANNWQDYEYHFYHFNTTATMIDLHDPSYVYGRALEIKYDTTLGADDENGYLVIYDQDDNYYINEKFDIATGLDQTEFFSDLIYSFTNYSHMIYIYNNSIKYESEWVDFTNGAGASLLTGSAPTGDIGGTWVNLYGEFRNRHYKYLNFRWRIGEGSVYTYTPWVQQTDLATGSEWQTYSENVTGLAYDTTYTIRLEVNIQSVNDQSLPQSFSTLEFYYIDPSYSNFEVWQTDINSLYFSYDVNLGNYRNYIWVSLSHEDTSYSLHLTNITTNGTHTFLSNIYTHPDLNYNTSYTFTISSLNVNYTLEEDYTTWDERKISVWTIDVSYNRATIKGYAGLGNLNGYTNVIRIYLYEYDTTNIIYEKTYNITSDGYYLFVLDNLSLDTQYSYRVRLEYVGAYIYTQTNDFQTRNKLIIHAQEVMINVEMICIVFTLGLAIYLGYFTKEGVVMLYMTTGLLFVFSMAGYVNMFYPIITFLCLIIYHIVSYKKFEGDKYGT